MSLRKPCKRVLVGGLPNPIRNVDRVEIRVRHKLIYCLAPDMVGIDVVRPVPSQRLDGGIRSLARGGRLGANGDVLAIGLVPDGNHLHSLLRGHQTGAQLRLGLMRKTVAYPQRIFLK